MNPEIYEIKNRQPEFDPHTGRCWIWTLIESRWLKLTAVQVSMMGENCTHWHPDQPEAPKVRPDEESLRHECLQGQPGDTCTHEFCAPVASPQKPGLKEAVGGELLTQECNAPFPCELLSGHGKWIRFEEWTAKFPPFDHGYTHWRPVKPLTPFLTPATPPIQPIHANSDNNNGASFLKASPRPWKVDGTDLWHVGKSYTHPTDPHLYTGIRIDPRLEDSECALQNLALIVAAVNAYSPPATGEGELKHNGPHQYEKDLAWLLAHSGNTIEQTVEEIVALNTRHAPLTPTPKQGDSKGGE